MNPDVYYILYEGWTYPVKTVITDDTVLEYSCHNHESEPAEWDIERWLDCMNLEPHPEKIKLLLKEEIFLDQL